MPVGPGQVMRCEDYSTLSRLLRVTAWMLRIVKVLKCKTTIKTTTDSVAPSLSVEEISEAERQWILESQLLLEKDKKLDSWRKQLGAFLEAAGMWKYGGRLSNADIPHSAKHPILLHRDHHLTSLIVKSAHERVLHDGLKETPTELRSRYWIVRGRSLAS